MKQTQLIIAVLILLTAATACQREDGDAGTKSSAGSAQPVTEASGYPKRYLVESGIIEFEMSGPQSGKETIYFDKWGWREARYTNSELSIAGITRKENKLSIMDGDWVYNIDLERRTGTKVKNTLLPQFIDGAKKKGQNMTELGEEMLANMGGQKVGTEQVAGKTCDVWETKSLGSKSCVWQGVTLKTQVNMAGMQITSTATRFEENGGVPADRFVVPGDVVIKESIDPQSVLKGIREKTKGR
ncbi:MAG TPA: hypothetical protein VNO50_12920 [Pyrinomonadaceae bacterium]|nr:hypothetical protein [Pyrinomonadaceae bacterium]